MAELTQAEETAGETGVLIANRMAAKVEDVIDGFPASTVEQRAAIAGLIAEKMENLRDRLLGT